MTKQEAVRRLYGLIADINAEEAADHIKDGVSLCDWTNVWRCEAKDALRVLEDTADTPQTEETEAERLDRIDNEIEDAWARIKELTPQTDCGWGEPNE